MIKRVNDDIKADRPTLDEVKFIPNQFVNILLVYYEYTVFNYV